MPSFNARACNDRRSLDDKPIFIRVSFLNAASATRLCCSNCAFEFFDYFKFPASKEFKISCSSLSSLLIKFTWTMLRSFTALNNGFQKFHLCFLRMEPDKYSLLTKQLKFSVRDNAPDSDDRRSLIHCQDEYWVLYFWKWFLFSGLRYSQLFLGERQNAIICSSVSNSPGPSDSLSSHFIRFDVSLFTMSGQDGGGDAQFPDGSLIWDLSELKFPMYSSASIVLNRTLLSWKLSSGP
jgi:hypothetical protein